MIGVPTCGGTRKRWRGTAILFGLVLLLSGCGGSSPKPVAIDEPVPSPTALGAVPQDRLEAMLLQPADLPGLGSRRAFASTALTTQSTPQLALCRGTAAVGPHELANVISEVTKPGGVKVFEVLSVFADEAAATAAFNRDVATAKACATYNSDGVAHRVSGLGPLTLEPGVEAVHYALVTSDVVSGDVRTYARRGAVTVLVSGFGGPPTGQPLLAYQADVMRKALARLS